MKGNIILFAAVWLMVLAVGSFAIPPDELPFGAMYLHEYNGTEVQKLSEDMCFNYFVEYTDKMKASELNLLYGYGIQGIRGGITSGGADGEPPMKYSWSNYAIIDVDYPYPNSEVRMENFGGSFQNGLWVAPRDSAVMLSGISTYQTGFTGAPKNRVAFFDKYLLALNWNTKIPYRLDLFAAIDDPDPYSNEIVATATIKVGMWNTCQMKAIYVDTILVRDFGSSSSLQWIEDDLNFVIPDSFTVVDWDSGSCDAVTFYTNLDNGVNKRWNPFVELDINTTGTREVKIDSIKISDQDGRDLMAGFRDEVITTQFQQYVNSGHTEEIYGWMLMDEPLYSNLLPFRHIDSLMHAVYSSWVTFTDNWHYSPVNTVSRSYLDIVGVDFLNPDIYPYGLSDVYAGVLFQDTLTVGGEKKSGPLSRFPNHVSWVREQVDDRDKDFWLTVQAFSGRYWRYPTASELSVNVFIALAWGCRGVQFWYYDPPSGWSAGLRDPQFISTDLYYEVKDNIGPYIQAVDSFYMPLTWDRCYTYKPDHEYDPPGSAYIESISTYTNPDTANPDTGWYQIGEFHDDAAKYIMIVNRACSQGPDDPEPAPSVTAVVRLDPENLDLGNYVYVIDLADSLYRDTTTGEWVGVPKTTYTAKMPDGTIPFTTVLGPGEGRLYRLTATR